MSREPMTGSAQQADLALALAGHVPKRTPRFRAGKTNAEKVSTGQGGPGASRGETSST